MNINIKKRIKKDFDKIKTPLITILFFLVLFSGIYFLGPGLVGLFIAEEGLISYEQNVSITAVNDKTEIWSLAEYPEAFDLRTVQLSGNYLGNGTFNVYLEDEQGTRYLILDNSAIEEENLVSVTGYTIAVDVSDEEIEELEKVFEEAEEKEKKDKEEKEKKDKEAETEETAEQQDIGELVTGIIQDIVQEETSGEEVPEDIVPQIVAGNPQWLHAPILRR